MPDVDTDPAAHAGVANVVVAAVLCALRAMSSGSVEDALDAAEQVDQLIEHWFGGSDLDQYHQELDKLRGLPPEEIMKRGWALARRGTRDPRRKKAEALEKGVRGSVLAALESAGDDPHAEQVRALARADRLTPP